MSGDGIDPHCTPRDLPYPQITPITPIWKKQVGWPKTWIVHLALSIFVS
jgi:hypothetical protein